MFLGAGHLGGSPGSGDFVRQHSTNEQNDTGEIMAKQMNVKQAMRIKTLLAERRLNITSLAFKLKEAYGSVANTIYGHRHNRELQDKIAAFLGHTPEELFIRTAGGDACATGGDFQATNLGHQDEVTHG
jgi:hypothetical protein